MTRPTGIFNCAHPTCGKKFSRRDHLARHQRNHQPLRYLCRRPQCTRAFARKDLLAKHEKRHAREDAGDDDGAGENGADAATTQRKTEPAPFWLLAENARSPSLNAPLSTADLIEWILDDRPEARVHESGRSLEYPAAVSPMALLEALAVVLPDFPPSPNRAHVSEPVRQSLVALVPQLEACADFLAAHIARAIQVFWLAFHSQYPLLHRPSFSNERAHPLLLLAMVMVGASLVPSMALDGVFSDAAALAQHIADPLRWLILAHPQCHPPAKVWVVQSLILLEWFEILLSSRRMHERAYLHHGLKIQLLRRLPILGGDPLKDDMDDTAQALVWNQWIEAESMKRATLIAFYLDTVHASVYGHNMVLYAHQIKMSLPCDDDLWEFDNLGQGVREFNPRSVKFLLALKLLLRHQYVETSALGSKILLAGILAVMYQLQQKEVQAKALEWCTLESRWRALFTDAIYAWRAAMENCCDSRKCVSYQHSQDAVPPMLGDKDTRCKISLYHIAQIYMRISHYDYIIYAGAPSRMNVPVGMNEYRIVEKRIHDWAAESSGRIAVVHAYLFLFEMFLHPEHDDITFAYNPNHDPMVHRRNIVVSCVLVIFAYNFSLHGPELNIIDSVVEDLYPEREDAYEYLKQVRRSFREAASGTQLLEVPYYSKDLIELWLENLLQQQKTQHIVGLLKLVARAYKSCIWEVGREYSRLLVNCIRRCLGQKQVFCTNMYEA